MDYPQFHSPEKFEESGTGSTPYSCFPDGSRIRPWFECASSTYSAQSVRWSSRRRQIRRMTSCLPGTTELRRRLRRLGRRTQREDMVSLSRERIPVSADELL